ncbi:MAG TPA: amino acid permease [Spirochaetia bacterium]|nr:amino acid permease [Spirochaetia bacterium]
MADEKKLSLFGIVFLGLGSVIGSGYFLASGIVIQLAGPAAALGYLLGAVLLYRVMTAMGDLALAYPHRQSFRGYLQESLGATAGFLAGWNSWLSNLVAMASEVVAMGIFTRFWLPGVPLWVFTTGYALLAGLINLFGLNVVDKAEVFFSGVKIMSLLGFAGLAVFLLGTGHPAPGPLFSAPAFFPHGINGLGQAMLIITFSFGIGAVGVTVGRTENPRRMVPLAINLVTLGQAVLYILPTLALVAVVPWQAVSTRISPFVLALNHVGLGTLDTAFNAVILSSSLSLLVGSMFSGLAMMVSLAKDREAPTFLAGRLKWRRLHLPALAVTVAALVAVSFTAYFLPTTAYGYVTASAGFFSMLTWFYILLGQGALRVRGQKGRTKTLVTAVLAVVSIIVIVVFALQAAAERIAAVFPLAALVILLGVRLTIIYRKERPLPGEGPGVVQWLACVLQRRRSKV